ncbi:MAG: hypothetical protein ACI9G1_005256, partial [Pirellulaceae bacterium]
MSCLRARGTGQVGTGQVETGQVEMTWKSKGELTWDVGRTHIDILSF